MDTLLTVLLALCALGSVRSAAVFFAFSNFVMPALARIPPAEGIHAMQAINVTVLNQLFLGIFMGTVCCRSRRSSARCSTGTAPAASAPCSQAPPTCWVRSW
jgi:hypothetical protein